MKISKNYIPNFLTLGNLMMGCIAIVCFSDANYMLLNYEPEAGDYTVRFFSDSLVQGTFFVFLAAVFDFFDGMVARMLHATSVLGKQLDSLSDVVSFGVAPGLAMYQMLKYSLASTFNYTEIPGVLLLPALLIPCAAAYRLAKFNIADSNEKLFQGLPSPAAGLAVVAVVWSYIAIEPIRALFYHPVTIYFVIALFSWLMVASTPMHKLHFGQWKQDKKNTTLIALLALVSVLGFFVIGYFVVFVSVLVYILFSIIAPPKANLQ